MVAKGLEITGAESFGYLAPMPSIPVALFIFRFWRSFRIKESVTREMENSGVFSNFNFTWSLMYLNHGFHLHY